MRKQSDVRQSDWELACALGFDALNGDSNDAEHDALYAILEASVWPDDRIETLEDEGETLRSDLYAAECSRDEALDDVQTERDARERVTDAVADFRRGLISARELEVIAGYVAEADYGQCGGASGVFPLEPVSTVAA